MSKDEMSEQNEISRQCAVGIARSVRCHSDAMDYIDQAIEMDESEIRARVVKAWMLHGGRESTVAESVDTLIKEVEERLPATQNYDSQLLAALKLSKAGRSSESATVLEAMLLKTPTDLYLHKIVQDEIFWLGKSDWMCAITEQAAPHWQTGTKDYGTFLSYRAFANEEAGFYDEAERYSRMALEIDPTDIWGTHALAHTLLMKGKMHTGIESLQELSANWGHANQMRHHLWWHMCLFLLETGEHEKILHLLSAEIRNPESALVKASPAAPIDIQNYASLLLRLELYGLDVSEQWLTLADICAARVNNHGNAFGNIHDMMVLTATGQHDKADEFMRSMRSEYAEKQDDVALAYNAVGIPVCEALIAYRGKDYDTVLKTLGGLRHNLSLIGGSHAQRDVFYHLLVHAAEKANQPELRNIYIRDIERIGFCDVPNRAAYQSLAH